MSGGGGIDTLNDRTKRIGYSAQPFDRSRNAKNQRRR